MWPEASSWEVLWKKTKTKVLLIFPSFSEIMVVDHGVNNHDLKKVIRQNDSEISVFVLRDSIWHEASGYTSSHSRQSFN